jgi:hypothetical protein
MVQAVDPTPPTPPAVSPLSKFRQAASSLAAAVTPSLFDNGRPFAEPDYTAKPKAESNPEESPMDAFTFAKETTPTIPESTPPPLAKTQPAVEPEIEEVEVMDLYTQSDIPDPEPIEDESSDELIEIHAIEEVPVANGEQQNAHETAAQTPEPTPPTALPKGSGFTLISKKRPSVASPWGKRKPLEFPEDIPDDAAQPQTPAAVIPEPTTQEPIATPAAEGDPEPPKLKLGIKTSGLQNELSLDSTPRGRFEGETPNVFDGEDLDLPPFLRKKR